MGRIAVKGNLSICKLMRPSSARRDIKGADMPLKNAHWQAGRADGPRKSGVRVSLCSRTMGSGNGGPA